MTEDHNPARPDYRHRWLRVLVYYAIAIGLSAASRLVFHTNDFTGAWPPLARLGWHLFSGVGPATGALVVWLLFRAPRTMSLGGTEPALAGAMLVVPVVAIAAIGVANPYGFAPQLFGLMVGIWIAIYATLEEIGWRGYLQGEFADCPPVVRYVIVALFWYPWHLTFLQGHAIGTELSIFGLIVAASCGIGFVADRTGSVLAAASVHIAGNIMGLTAYFTIFIPASNARLGVVGVSAIAWALILRVWRQRTLRKG